ncbi:MAG: hypothetical protein U5J78_04935 [Parasphingorhabdus sp.]|nr:hypothetical protein [Parasphingorhabdus sp.]
MDAITKPPTPWHLWAVGLLSLLWNAIGITSYLMTVTGNLGAAGMSPAQIAYMAETPAWAVAFWALGVWGAFLGSIFLLLRRHLAVSAFAVALIGLAGSTVFQRLLSNMPEEMRGLGLAVAIWVISIALLFYAFRMRKAGVLR